MSKNQKVKQGSLNSIIAIVMIFLIIDIIVALIMLLNIDINNLFKDSGLSDNVVKTVITDNN